MSEEERGSRNRKRVAGVSCSLVCVCLSVCDSRPNTKPLKEEERKDIRRICVYCTCSYSDAVDKGRLTIHCLGYFSIQIHSLQETVFSRTKLEHSEIIINKKEKK